MQGETRPVPVVAFRGWPDIDPPAERGVEPGSIPLSTTTCASLLFQSTTWAHLLGLTQHITILKLPTTVDNRWVHQGLSLLITKHWTTTTHYKPTRSTCGKMWGFSFYFETVKTLYYSSFETICILTFFQLCNI